jgi:hypothetical protein
VRKVAYDRAYFLDRSVPEPNSGCWLWLGSVNANGYGKIGGKLAHRMAWAAHNGPVPDGLNVLHSCDVRCCINPAHLFLGTQPENVADCIAKDRHAYGQRSGRARITPDIAHAIYSADGAYSAVAAEFRTTAKTVEAIKRGETWARTTSGIARKNGTKHVPKGRCHWNAALDEDAARAIRKDRRFSRIIAAEYGVSRQTIDDVRNGTSWRHA